MTASETIEVGWWVDYSPIGGPSYGGGGIIAGSALALFEGNVGKKGSIVHYNSGNWMSGGVYQSFDGVGGGPDRRTNLNRILADGRIPMTPWFPWDQSTPANDQALNCANIIAGNHDAYITAWATAVKAWGGPLIIRLMIEEQLTNQYPWQYGSTGSVSVTWGGNTWTNDYPTFKGAWAHVVSIFRAVGVDQTKVRFVWCPNVRANTDAMTYALMYPGDAVTDILGFDGYASKPTYSFVNSWRGGGSTGLVDSYAEMCAIHPTKPLMISECSINAVNNIGPVAVTSITTNGTTWTVTVPTQPANGAWAATQGVTFTGSSPAGYNGQYTIAGVSGSGPYVLTINNTTQPGAFVSSTAQMSDRISRAASWLRSFDIDIPAMPRIKHVVLFMTAYGTAPAAKWTPDYDGTANTADNIDLAAFRRGVGGGHYLAGGLIGTDVTSRTVLPFQDKPMVLGVPAGSIERYRAVRKSMRGLVGAWNLTDAAGPVLDDSGNGRNGTLVGTTALNGANVIPAEPQLTSAVFPGTIGNNINVATNAAFSPANTGQFTIETSWFLPSAPTARGVVVGVGAVGQYCWEVWVSATQYGCTLHQLGSTTYADYAHTLPANLTIPHHVVFVVDTSQTPPMVGYLDAAAGLNSTGPVGSIGVSTAPLVFGQLGDSTLPLTPAGACVGPTWLWNVAHSAESVAELNASWIAGPIPSSIVAVPNGLAADVTWTTDVPASSQIEYGPTSSYGAMSAYDLTRVTSHAQHLSSLQPGTAHYRIRSRNGAGIESIGADHSMQTSTLYKSITLDPTNPLKIQAVDNGDGTYSLGVRNA